MAESMGSVCNLGYFTRDDLLFVNRESFRDSDKNRFFQFYPHDSLTTVAISRVQLRGPQIQYTDVNVLTRSGSVKGHAERQTVDKIKQIIEQLTNPGTKLETLLLVMNITYSPCNDCQNVLEKFFESLDCNITFVLRFAYLYHEKGVKGDDKPVEQLANWMIGLERECGEGFTMTVESIEVTKELSRYSHRVKEKWESVKKEREEKDKAMKDTIRQVYERKGEIEEENRKRDEAEAARMGKMLYL